MNPCFISVFGQGAGFIPALQSPRDDFASIKEHNITFWPMQVSRGLCQRPWVLAEIQSSPFQWSWRERLYWFRKIIRFKNCHCYSIVSCNSKQTCSPQSPTGNLQDKQRRRFIPWLTPSHKKNKLCSNCYVFNFHQIHWIQPMLAYPG